MRIHPVLRTLKAAPLLALIALPLVLAGCGKSQGRNPVAPQTQSLTEASSSASRADGNSRGSRGYTKVMFVHASPDAPAVDIYAGKRQVARDLAFPNNTRYRVLRAGMRDVRVNVAGTYDLEVRVAGTQNVVLPLPGIKLEAGKIYTVFAKCLLNGTGAQALGAQIIVNSDSRNYGDAGRDGDDDDEDRK